MTLRMTRARATLAIPKIDGDTGGHLADSDVASEVFNEVAPFGAGTSNAQSTRQRWPLPIEFCAFWCATDPKSANGSYVGSHRTRCHKMLE